MDNAGLAKKLASLAQLDFDAAQAYNEAAPMVGKSDSEIREHILLFYEDHKRHAKTLSDAISGLGELPPHFSIDIMGYAFEDVTLLLGATGTFGAMIALEQNEKLVAQAYADMLDDSDFSKFPMDVQSIFKAYYDDEKRHLAYIESVLDQIEPALKK